MAQSLALNLALVVLAFGGCKTNSFTGDSNEAPAQTPRKENPPAKVPNDPVIVPDEPAKPGEFGLGKIQDRFVNTGDRSANYSEDLFVPISPTGGVAPYKLSIVSTPSNPRISLVDGKVFWRPGYSDATGYHTEEGKYSVTVTATDSQGANTSSTFNISAVLLSWKSTVVASSDKSDMVVDFTINEKLHPARIYANNPVVLKQNLNSRVCRNMANPGQSFSMDASPAVQSMGKTSSTSGGADHKMRLSMRYPLEKQPLNDMMFVTRLNFMAQDDGKNVQSGETGIFIIYSYARCRNSSLSDTECKKSILLNGGKSSLYYCSDYNGANSTEQTMQNAFCGTVRLNGVSVPGC